MTSRVILSIAAPGGYALIDDVENTKHEDEWFTYSRSYDQNESRILFERIFAITSPKVDAKDYEQAKQAVVKIGKIDKEPIVLKRGS
jgi:hypothetical protein